MCSGMWLRSMTVPVVTREILAALRLAAAVAAGALLPYRRSLAAVRAHRAVRPAAARHHRAGGVFVLEIGGGQYVHGVLSGGAILALAFVVSTT